MGMRTWRFESRWPLPAAREVVYGVLADADRYPQWWPQVRSVTRLDADHGLVRCRSALPLTIAMEVTAVIRDRDAGVLEVALDGDLRGWSRFTLDEDVHYEQEVISGRRIITLAPRWLLATNHAWMMRSARRGLAAAVQPGTSGRRG